jgi:hypothetical protein
MSGSARAPQRSPRDSGDMTVIMRNLVQESVAARAWAAPAAAHASAIAAAVFCVLPYPGISDANGPTWRTRLVIGRPTLRKCPERLL